MPNTIFNKYRAAIEVIQRGRDVLVDTLADEILDQSDDLVEGGFQFNEFLESQGTRLHFLCLIVSQLEQSAELIDQAQSNIPDPPTAPKKRRSRAKKVPQQTSKTKEETVDET